MGTRGYVAGRPAKRPLGGNAFTQGTQEVSLLFAPVPAAMGAPPRRHQGDLLYEGTRRGAVFTVTLPPFAG